MNSVWKYRDNLQRISVLPNVLEFTWARTKGAPIKLPSTSDSARLRMKKFRFDDLALTGFFSSLLVKRRTHRLPKNPTAAATAISALTVNLTLSPTGVKTYCLFWEVAFSDEFPFTALLWTALEFIPRGGKFARQSKFQANCWFKIFLPRAPAVLIVNAICWQVLDQEILTLN